MTNLFNPDPSYWQPQLDFHLDKQAVEPPLIDIDALAKQQQEAGLIQGQGLKFDGEKPRMDLLDPSWLEGVASVLTFGAQKYAAHNWRNGINISRLIGAAYRHLGAYNHGEDLDPESSLNHLLHASCCLQFAYWMMQNKPSFDDRYKY